MRMSFTVKTVLDKDKLLEKAEQVLWLSMNKMMGLAKRYAPFDTGKLSTSIHLIPDSKGSRSYILADGVDYGIHMEFGCFFGKGKRIKILTNRGYKSLENVLIGDLVLTHKNRWKKVISKPEYIINKKIPRFTFETMSGKKITVTEEHPLRIKGEFGYFWKKARNVKKEDILLGVD